MIRSIRNSLIEKWKALSVTPFAVLVRLFMNRILHGSNSGEDELNLSLGLALALLATPGGFISLFLFDKYASLLRWLRGQPDLDTLAAAMPDEYFFIVVSMAVTGGVALWWWDSIFPDRRDFANLAPLPISTSYIFLANTTALVLLACIFAIDVNAASSILFPLVVSAPQTSFSFLAHFAAVHAFVVVLSSIFSFLAVFAMVGLLMLFLPYAVFRRVSLYVRSLILILLLLALSTSFVVPGLVLRLPERALSLVRLLPSVWFLGFCQLLRGRASPALAQLGHFAILALLSVCLVAVITYAVSYQRCFVLLPELAETPQGDLGVRTAKIFSLLDRLILFSPAQRAGYRFVCKTLLRNEGQALALGGFAGLGLVLASRALLPTLDNAGGNLPSAEQLSIPLILSYSLLIGVRLIFDIPASLQANWIFRLLLNMDRDHSVALARRVMLSFTLPWLFAIAFPIYLHFWGWRVALPHIAVVSAWSVLLTEILLLRFRKLPFTCSYPPFRHSAVVLVFLFAIGFVPFVGITAEFESGMFTSAARGIVFAVVGLIVWGIVRWVRQGVVETDKQTIFEDVPTEPFEFLHLSQWNQG